jgi:hypothetical protein
VRVVDVFVDAVDLGALGFEGVDPVATSTSSPNRSSPSMAANSKPRL